LERRLGSLEGRRSSGPCRHGTGDRSIRGSPTEVGCGCYGVDIPSGKAGVGSAGATKLGCRRGRPCGGVAVNILLFSSCHQLGLADVVSLLDILELAVWGPKDDADRNRKDSVPLYSTSVKACKLSSERYRSLLMAHIGTIYISLVDNVVQLCLLFFQSGRDIGHALSILSDQPLQASRDARADLFFASHINEG
jgi:hypothetical protein